MGNRGILHGNDQRLGRQRWQHKAWVTCRLVWKDWHRTVMSPNAYTELFFWDEAVALAAGHRPCALCRREHYNAYREAAGMSGPVAEMDAALHAERAIPRRFEQRRHQADVESLPDGAIILDEAPKLVFGDAVREVRADGYGPPTPRPTGAVTVLTPPMSVRAMAEGYEPELVLP